MIHRSSSDRSGPSTTTTDQGYTGNILCAEVCVGVNNNRLNTSSGEWVKCDRRTLRKVRLDIGIGKSCALEITNETKLRAGWYRGAITWLSPIDVVRNGPSNSGPRNHIATGYAADVLNRR